MCVCVCGGGGVPNDFIQFESFWFGLSDDNIVQGNFGVARY